MDSSLIQEDVIKHVEPQGLFLMEIFVSLAVQYVSRADLTNIIVSLATQHQALNTFSITAA